MELEYIERAHRCKYSDRLEEMEKKLEALTAQFEQLRKQVLGPKSERMPSPAESIRKTTKADPAKTKAKRAARKEAREAKAHLEEVIVEVPESERRCPSCGDEAQPVRARKTSEVYSYVPGYFRRRVCHRETVACPRCDYIATAPAPARVLGQSKYDAGFIAHLVTWKVCDSISLYRMEKRFKRMGMPIARTTMNGLFQKTGAALQIIARRIQALVVEQRVVLADETSLPVVKPKKCKRGFIWTFNARTMAGDALVAYRFSMSRSGETPVQVLGGSEGVLVVDGYSGYNAVTTPEGRARAACLAHVRRKFFDARAHAPDDIDAILELILDVYRIEHLALAQGIVRTDKHFALRQTQGREKMNAFFEYIDNAKSRYPPRSAIGKAIAHTLKNKERLSIFLDDVDVPIDNNASERFLRPVAKGRDNWLFAGSEESAENIAALMTITSTSEANQVNPEAYIADILTRLDSHPASRLDELLPHRWAKNAE